MDFGAGLAARGRYVPVRRGFGGVHVVVFHIDTMQSNVLASAPSSFKFFVRNIVFTGIGSS